MILTGCEISKQVKCNNIVISPYNESQINPNSYDFRLGNKLKYYQNNILDPFVKQEVHEIEIKKEGFVISSDKIYLGSTLEKMGSNKFVPIIKGKSSLARLGLFIHITADLIDIGSINHWTLQLFAVQPIKLFPGMLIGQVTFWTVLGNITLYSGKYRDTIGPCESLSYKDFKNKIILMYFSDASIIRLIEEKRIEIYPSIDLDDIRPTGIRVHLDDKILIPIDNQTIDLEHTNEIKYNKVKISKKGFLLKRDMFILGSTVENIKTSRDILGHLEGRSTIARFGLLIHCTSGVIDSNYDEPRAIVLEIKNIGNFDLILRPQMPIGMLLLSQLSEPIKQDSQSQYKHQKGVEPPNIKYKTRKQRKRDINE